MKKTLSCTLAALTILLVLSATINTAPAVNYANIGVKVGDTAVYHSSFDGSTANKTVILVYGIVGTQIYLNITDYLPNNAVANKYQLITDTQAGSFLGWLYLIASNLTTNDPVYSGAIYKINSTKSMSIGGATRTVDVLNITTIGLTAYWDKTLGIMVKLNLWFFGWSNYTMISFTSPGAPSAPGGLSLSILAAIGEGVVIIVLLVYIVMSRRGHKGRK